MDGADPESWLDADLLPSPPPDGRRDPPGPAAAHADVVVAGSGASGLTAALAAAVAGADVLLVERGDRFGETTALSGGRVWIPGNHLTGGDTPAAAASYLDGIFSARYRHMTEVFLDTAPDDPGAGLLHR